MTLSLPHYVTAPDVRLIELLQETIQKEETSTVLEVLDPKGSLSYEHNPHFGGFFLNMSVTPPRGFFCPFLFPLRAFCIRLPAMPFTSGTNFGSEVVP